jgi:hypothetical protein
LRKNKFTFLAVEAPVWQGAKVQAYRDIFARALSGIFFKFPPSLTDIFIKCSEEGGMPDEPYQKRHYCVYLLMHTVGWTSIDCTDSLRTI